jgi:VCBS repeat-containing protein
VLFNDTDPDDDLLSAVLVSNVNNGTLNLAADGSFTYDPALNFNGQDSFTYKANDGLVDSNIVTVTIDVNPINDAPEATVDGYSMDSNTTLTVPAPGVLENDTDVEGSALTAVLVSDVSTGTLNFNADGSFFYSPTLDFEGEASFTYEANDGLLDSAVTNVTITVNAVNEVVINSISPDFGIPGDSFSVTVTGSGFMTGATLSFANGTGPAPTASGFDVALDGTSLSADITIKNGGPRRNRTWSVQVTNPDGSAGVLVDSFTIIVQ